jgi:hypothetical protein
MRIWSLHPKYLDTKGLVAVWRETLLAKHVLEGKTKGYKQHPQLNRFKGSPSPIDNINHYLSVIHEEATLRKYQFDNNKLNWKFRRYILTVTDGQLKYELAHLRQKLKLRDHEKYKLLRKIEAIEPHPLFEVVAGEVEDWEIIE